MFRYGSKPQTGTNWLQKKIPHLSGLFEVNLLTKDRNRKGVLSNWTQNLVTHVHQWSDQVTNAGVAPTYSTPHCFPVVKIANLQPKVRSICCLNVQICSSSFCQESVFSNWTPAFMAYHTSRVGPRKLCRCGPKLFSIKLIIWGKRSKSLESNWCRPIAWRYEYAVFALSLVSLCSPQTATTTKIRQFYWINKSTNTCTVDPLQQVDQT